MVLLSFVMKITKAREERHMVMIIICAMFPYKVRYFLVDVGVKG
jgi:hypothetical protein